MNRNFTFLIIILFFNNFQLLAQNNNEFKFPKEEEIESYSKKELKNYLESLLKTYETKCLDLMNLNMKISILEKSELQSKNELDILKKEHENLKNQIKISQERILEEEKKVRHLKDSMNWIMKVSKVSLDSNKMETDFLDTYLQRNRVSSNLNLNLELKKVLLFTPGYQGIKYSNKGWGTEDDMGYGVSYFPEILDIENIEFYWQSEFVTNKGWTKELSEIELARFQEFLPAINIIENKLFKLNYPDGRVENFLLNKESGIPNNFKRTFKWELASENVKTDGDKNLENDIVWKFFLVDKEWYLILDEQQLERINFPFYKQIARAYNEEFYNGPGSSGIVMLIKKTINALNQNGTIQPSNTLFLFKLKSLN